MEVPECDYIISNPPYSKKGEVLERLFSLGIPFAMLVGVAGLLRVNLDFNYLKIMILNCCILIRESIF